MPGDGTIEREGGTGRMEPRGFLDIGRFALISEWH